MTEVRVSIPKEVDKFLDEEVNDGYKRSQARSSV